MNSSKTALKDLLVAKRKILRTKGGPRLLQVEPSPLLTNFEKWSDKKRKLYFDDDQSMAAHRLGSFQLERNLFASLLASPMRCERISRIKVPKDFLTQLKLQDLRPKNDKHSLQLAVVNGDSKGGKSSYVVNSGKLLKKNAKSSNSWIPIPALTSNMRYFNVSDVLVDKENIADDCIVELKRRLKCALGKLQDKGIESTLGNWDVVVRFDDLNGCKPFEIIQWKSYEVVIFNAKFFICEPWMSEALHSHKNHELGLVLKLPEDKELVRCIYRLWASLL